MYHRQGLPPHAWSFCVVPGCFDFQSFLSTAPQYDEPPYTSCYKTTSLKYSTLLQMLIKGIRSFSPDNQAVIEFYKPLTLIVGQNGAGKTVGPR